MAESVFLVRDKWITSMITRDDFERMHIKEGNEITALTEAVKVILIEE